MTLAVRDSQVGRRFGGRFGGPPLDRTALDGPNNFHLLRLAAALLVLLAHSFHLLNAGAAEPIGRWFARLDASLLGVSIFFFLSGFLVSRSWDRRRDLVDFFVARSLRIAPALWVCIAVTALVVGPALTTEPLARYFTDERTLGYLTSNAVLHTQYMLPGVFETNPVQGVNGSLWTIPLEVVLYAILGIGGWLGLLASRAGVRAILHRVTGRPVLGAVLMLLAALLVSKVVRSGPQYYGLAGYFVLGALCYRFRALLTVRIDLAVALVVLALFTARTWLQPIVVPLALAAAIVALALHPALRMRPTWLHRHDYSYGTYLYGFPVQQLLIAAGIADPWLLFAAATVLTLGCAALSWHVVERPCLALKLRLTHAVSRLVGSGVSSRIRLFRVRSP